MRTMFFRAAVFLLLGVFSRCRGTELIQAVTGSNVTFTANVVGQPSELTWLVYFSDTNISKIVHLEEKIPPEIFKSFKNRVIADLSERTLILINVTPADSRRYTARSVVNEKFSDIDYSLQVYDHVCQVWILPSTEEHNITLHCICPPPGASPSKYTWINGSKPFSESQNITVSKEGISQHFTCVASNVVSSSKANFTVPARAAAKSTVNIAAIVVPIIIIVVGSILYYLQRKGLLFSMCRSKTEAQNAAENGEGAQMLNKPLGEAQNPAENGEGAQMLNKPPGDASGSNGEGRQNLKPEEGS